MQPDRFTIKAQEAVAAAQRLAAEGRNTEVAPAHLLLALLEQEDGLVVPVLRKLNADVEAIPGRTLDAIARAPTLSGDAAPDVRLSSEFVRASSGRRRRCPPSATSTSRPSTCCSRSPSEGQASPTCSPTATA